MLMNVMMSPSDPNENALAMGGDHVEIARPGPVLVFVVHENCTARTAHPDMPCVRLRALVCALLRRTSPAQGTFLTGHT